MAKEPTQKEMLQTLTLVIVGIPGNPDENGMIGDIKEIKQDIKAQNSRINKVEGKQKFLYGLVAGAGTFGGVIGSLISRVLGG